MRPSIATVIGAALFLTGCDSSGTRLPAAPGSGPVTDGYALSGQVTTSGRPAIGARVTVLEELPEPWTTTDDGGNYRIPGLPASHIWGRTLVRFSQPGFFTEFKRTRMITDTRVDVVLDPLVVVAVGDVVRGSVSASDPKCAGQDYEDGACQRFAVIPPATGMLGVTLTTTGAPTDAALDVVNAAGDAIAEFFGQPKRISLAARAGETWEIRVVIDRVAPVDFELRTVMR